MTSKPTRMLKMMYSGNLEYISSPVDSKYEDIVEIAIERFSIPNDFKDFIQISNEFRYTFDKDTFEYFVFLFPNPEIVFFIRVDYGALLDSFRLEIRKPFTKLHNKRRNSEEDEGVPVTRQNCFIGSLPGNDSSEEPEVKRIKSDFTKYRPLAMKKTSSKSCIRI